MGRQFSGFLLEQWVFFRVFRVFRVGPSLFQDFQGLQGPLDTMYIHFSGAEMVVAGWSAEGKFGRITER